MPSIEERIREILGGILAAGAPPVGRRPLRELGLNSLGATRFVLELRMAFGVDVPLLELDKCQDVSALADWIADRQTETAGSAGSGGGRGDQAQRHEPFSLTPLQQAYLVGKHGDLDPVGCHLYREFAVAGLDVTRLQTAWHQVQGHHEALRLEVTADGRQRIAREAVHCPIPVHAAPDQAGYEAQLERTRERMSHRRYEPGETPMYSVEATTGPQGQAVVHLSIDGMLVDGIGLDLLLHDWWHFYADPREPLPQPSMTLRDCIVMLEEQAGGAAYQADLDYWAKQLAGLPAGPDILGPAGSHDGDGTGEPVVLRRRPLDAAIGAAPWRALRATAERLGVPPNALLLAGFTQTLAGLGAQEPYSLVLTTTRRTHLPAEAQKVVGAFTSTSILIVESMAEAGVDGRAKALHQRLWQDLDHARVGGSQAVQELRRRHGATAPELPVVFTSMVDAVPAQPAHGFETGHVVSQTSGIALDAQVWESDGGLRLHWDVTEELIAAGVAEVLFAAYVNALAAMAVHEPDRDIRRALNPLQQAYAVARDAGPTPWDGCQVYHSFHVSELDLPRLEAAWVKMMRAYDPLRTVVTADGELIVRRQAPDTWRIPVITLDSATRETYLEATAEDRVSRAFTLDTWPQFDLRVTRDSATRSTVHLTLDLVACDGRSVHFLLRELFRLYADPTAEPMAAASHEQWLASRPVPCPEHEQYWLKRVEALPPGPRLSAPSSADPRRTRHQGAVSGWRDLRERAAARGIGPDALLMSVLNDAIASEVSGPFAVPLVRWTEAARPYRPGEYTELSWLAHRPELDVWARASAYQEQIDADIHADTVSGLDALRRKVLRERGAGYPIVCTGLLELAEQPLPASVTAGEWRTCTPDVAMDCIAMDWGDDQLRCYWDVEAGKFAPGAPGAMFDRYLASLRDLAKLDDTPHQGPDQHRIVYEWNDTARPFTADGPVHLAFEEQARRRPDAVAVRWREGALTYREVNERANAIAWRLREAGLGAGSLVAVRSRRGPDLVVAVYGVLKAGGAYLPVEPQLPGERAHKILADSGASALVTTSGVAGWSPPPGLPIVDLDADHRGDPRNPEPLQNADDLAYVIYTSGSTGTPKGVAVTHRPLHNLFQWCTASYGLGPGDLGLCVTSLGFDLSVFDLLGLLGGGAALYVADEVQQKDPGLLLDILLTEPITFWNSAPTTLAQMAPLFSSAGALGTDNLRLVFLSGDYTPLSLPEQLFKTFPRARLVSLGGATEATVWSNYFPVTKVDASWKSIPYGWPIDNCRYYILDEARRPVSPGRDGDLWIAGACLSEGYLNQPELTAQRFVDDPFFPGERMYDTGDRASHFPDGTICFLGRRDNQVKIRGFRVELGEIEHRLRAHPAVRDAIVVARPDPSGDRKLAAYLLPTGAAAPGAGQLRRFAAETLPDYMVPNHFMFLDSYPATANGKLDRAALPWPMEAAAAAPEQPPPDSADLQALSDEIAQLFAGLLGVDRVDPEQDLWDQGATSFTMVQVSGALRKKHQRRIPVATLLADPTLRGIVAAVAGVVGIAHGTGPQTQPPPPPPPLAPPPVHPPAAEVAEQGPGEVELLDPAAREAFRSAGWSRRPAAPGAPVVELTGEAPPPEHYHWHGTRREFTGEAVELSALGELLRLLRPAHVHGKHRYLYPSAGDTYAVQIYLHVHDRGVHGLDAGIYYYRPDSHRLELLHTGEAIDRAAHFYYNRELRDRAGFELFLIGQTRGVKPLYGEDAERFLALEAGYLGGLLMSGQAQAGIGLCPVGSVATGRLREPLHLDNGHQFLQSFLGGAVGHPETAQDGHPRPFTAPSRSPLTQPLAVVGMAALMPGADELEGFWKLLVEGRSVLGPLPGRRAAAAGISGELAEIHGGYLADIDFDSVRFRITPAEAQTLDPRVGLVLEAVVRCVEDAGYTPAGLAATGRVGVYVAGMWPDHHGSGVDMWRAGEPPVFSGILADLPNRVSHTFGFTGPSVGVDAACSSSLAALHLAGEAIRRGECDSAIVAGVNLVTHPYHLALLNGLGLLAPSTQGAAGAGYAFDAAASGWYPAEGVGAVLLRPYSDASAGDPVHAVIEASGMGHAGRSVRFAAPNAEALARSVRHMLDAAALTPEDISYVECAAAGAAVADAAEVEALTEVFAGRAAALPIGTVKPNVGHLEAASGMSQLFKVLLQLRYGQLAPTLLAASRNPLAAWDPATLRVVDTAEPWPAGPRRAMINAVAATGSYAHVVVRQAGR